ncbi:MAG: orotate phosphoribosyltransferase [Thermoplasmata archaeon]|jgi:orotate phosphoribosyltransferase
MTSQDVPADERAAIANVLLDASAVRFGDFTLASGEKSDVYIDVKRAWTDPRRLRVLAGALAPRVGTTDRLAGMELGAVPLVVAVALQTGHPYVVLRKAAKEHGTRQAFEGEIPSGSRVLLIEDVSTTGGSSLRSIEIIRGAGGIVDRALVVVDRESGARERLAAVGVRLEPLLTLSQLRGARR